MSARLLGILVTAAGTLFLAAAPALASLADEVSIGRSVAVQIQNGNASCSTLSTAQYEQLGEYAMDRIVRSRAAHAAMNQAMGTQNADRMHQLMGRSFAGCASTTSAGVRGMKGADVRRRGWGAMMSASAWTWMHDGSWTHMSRGDRRLLGHSMMGSGYVVHHHRWSTQAIITGALGVVLLAALNVAAAAGATRST